MKIIKIVLFIFSIAFVSNITAQNVYTTKTGEKYHKSSCKYLKYSKKEITLKKAKLLGYSACAVCKPTGKNTQVKTTSTKSSLLNTQTQKTTATQCTSKTKTGTRCKRKTKNANGKCYQH
tara:strand:- start:17717 stop:18076 length:360 start_codon:yes stop_codon:yes gene_type:complete